MARFRGLVVWQYPHALENAFSKWTRILEDKTVVSCKGDHWFFSPNSDWMSPVINVFFKCFFISIVPVTVLMTCSFFGCGNAWYPVWALTDLTPLFSDRTCGYDTRGRFLFSLANKFNMLLNLLNNFNVSSSLKKSVEVLI